MTRTRAERVREAIKNYALRRAILLSDLSEVEDDTVATVLAIPSESSQEIATHAEAVAAVTPETDANGDRGSGKGWMGTSTGKKFWPLAPRPEDVDVRDIARGLAMTCRYGGQVKRFYCPTPDQRVLTADLRWVPAGDLHVDDELLGFDEHAVTPGQAGNPRRRWRHSKVLTAMSVRRKVVRLVFDDDTSVTASEEHPWLVASKAGGGNQRWRTSGEIARLVAEGKQQRMNQFVRPWKDLPDDRATGWFAGIMDGEGYFSTGGRTGTQLGIGQNPGLVLDEIRRMHRDFGFDFRESAVGQHKVVGLQLAGGWREAARLLGQVRPIRLLDKFVRRLRSGEFNKQLNGNTDERKIVVRTYDEGWQWVAGLETSSKTYICEGYGAHNSVAEHCVLVSRHVAPELALKALFHDCAEAYIGDMIRPLKHQAEMRAFRDAEAKIEAAVFEALGLVMTPEEHVAIKAIDDRILIDEICALSARPDYYLSTPLPKDKQALGVSIGAWSPADAERAFMLRYCELTSQAHRFTSYGGLCANSACSRRAGDAPAPCPSDGDPL